MTKEKLNEVFSDQNKLEVIEGVTTPIAGLTPEREPEPEQTVDGGDTATKTTPTVDATFKNRRADPTQTHEEFVATKVWEDNGSGFRPDTERFKKLLTLTRTATKQSVDGGADAMEETLEQGEDYTISIEPQDVAGSEWAITITPAEDKTFEKYAPNGMTWTYTLKERVNQDTGRLQIAETKIRIKSIRPPPAPAFGLIHSLRQAQMMRIRQVISAS